MTALIDTLNKNKFEQENSRYTIN